jgi:hypothetical protein
LRVGAARVEDRLIKQQRIGDTVAHEGVDLQALIVGHQHFLTFVVKRQNTLVDIDSRVDEGHLEVEARRANEIPDRLPEAQHQRLLGRVDDEGRHPDEYDCDEGDDRDRRSAQRPSHLAAPVVLDSGSSAI